MYEYQQLSQRWSINVCTENLQHLVAIGYELQECETPKSTSKLWRFPFPANIYSNWSYWQTIY